jgi:hypothetical protein
MHLAYGARVEAAGTLSLAVITATAAVATATAAGGATAGRPRGPLGPLGPVRSWGGRGPAAGPGSVIVAPGVRHPQRETDGGP